MFVCRHLLKAPLRFHLSSKKAFCQTSFHLCMGILYVLNIRNLPKNNKKQVNNSLICTFWLLVILQITAIFHKARFFVQQTLELLFHSACIRFMLSFLSLSYSLYRRCLKAYSKNRHPSVSKIETLIFEWNLFQSMICVNIWIRNMCHCLEWKW